MLIIWSEIKTATYENIAKISPFYNYLKLKSLQDKRFGILADNGLSSYMRLVVVYERKWGYLGGICTLLKASLFGRFH